VILNHVAHHTGFFVVGAAVLHAELSRRGDLHVVDVASIPDGLEDAGADAEHQQVLHRLFAEIMIEAQDLRFRAGLPDVQVPRAKLSQSAGSTGPPPNSVIASCIRRRKVSSSMAVRATPMMANAAGR